MTQSSSVVPTFKWGIKHCNRQRQRFYPIRDRFLHATYPAKILCGLDALLRNVVFVFPYDPLEDHHSAPVQPPVDDYFVRAHAPRHGGGHRSL
mmetsp:Transcript_41447/g.81233  ORF Transcript_41447/g.81233 Transcript_41447/m.81233 type:complete len:93 (+) Transcript_41447:337-615(+)